MHSNSNCRHSHQQVCRGSLPIVASKQNKTKTLQDDEQLNSILYTCKTEVAQHVQRLNAFLTFAKKQIEQLNNKVGFTV